MPGAHEEDAALHMPPPMQQTTHSRWDSVAVRSCLAAAGSRSTRPVRPLPGGLMQPARNKHVTLDLQNGMQEALTASHDACVLVASSSLSTGQLLSGCLSSASEVAHHGSSRLERAWRLRRALQALFLMAFFMTQHQPTPAHAFTFQRGPHAAASVLTRPARLASRQAPLHRKSEATVYSAWLPAHAQAGQTSTARLARPFELGAPSQASTDGPGANSVACVPAESGEAVECLEKSKLG
ncbi:hypothetical protein Efla_005545 [Eimeria flavescens]